LELLDDLDAALELASEGEAEYVQEASDTAASIRALIDKLEIKSLLSGELDANNAIMTINAGAGGTESCDWASMVSRMFTRFFEKQSWKFSVVDTLVGDEAGIKSVTIEVEGDFVYGMLKGENGVHRLVRVSPFDSNARRHTSFCSVSVTPVIDDSIEIEINPADLKVDTYRASGAGGQHVNKTDSAIRITHQPTGVVVQCQNQRSQHQNRDKAMQMLRSKLYEIEINKRNEAKQANEDSKSDISFGHQIRSYILHPYKMVKDHRTSIDDHDPDKVLDGGLDKFILENLIKNKAS